MVKYCSACWRKERHTSLRLNTMTYSVLLFSTLGLLWLLRPKQCNCCGKVRIF